MFLGFSLEKSDFILPQVGRPEIVIDIPSGSPEHSAGDKIEIAIVLYREVVVTNGGAETGGSLGLIGPGDDRDVGGLLAVPGVFLGSYRQRLDIEDIDVVVELFFSRGPVLESLGNRVVFDVVNRDRLLRAVAGRLDTEMLEPLVGAVSKAVHRAMQMHRRDGLVSIENVLHDLEVLVACGALVVNHQVIALGPIGIVVNRERRVHRFVVGPPDIDADVGPFLNALVEQLVLGGIVMTAAASDEQDLEGFGGLFLLRNEERESQKNRAGGECRDQDTFHRNLREGEDDEGKSGEWKQKIRRECGRQVASRDYFEISSKIFSSLSRAALVSAVSVSMTFSTGRFRASISFPLFRNSLQEPSNRVWS